MSDNRTAELLRDYAFVLRRLEYAADKPGSEMTLGEYEAEEKRVTDWCAQAIAATLGKSNETAKVLIDDMLDFIGNCCETTLDCDCCDPVDCKYLSGDGELAECTRYQDFLSRAKVIL